MGNIFVNGREPRGAMIDKKVIFEKGWTEIPLEVSGFMMAKIDEQGNLHLNGFTEISDVVKNVPVILAKLTGKFSGSWGEGKATPEYKYAYNAFPAMLSGAPYDSTNNLILVNPVDITNNILSTTHKSIKQGTLVTFFADVVFPKQQ